MDRSEAKAIVEEVLESMCWALQLQAWKITVDYKALEETPNGDVKVGTCVANAVYKYATIELNFDAFASREKLVDTLLHEMIHIFHADLDLYRRQVGEAVDDKTFDILDVMRDAAAESIVRHIETMLKLGLGLDAEKMMALSKAHEEGKEEVKP